MRDTPVRNACNVAHDPYSHAAYLLVHPEEQFVKVGGAHLASAEIRNYVMAGCLVAQLVFVHRNDAHQLVSAVLDRVPRSSRTIGSQHSILGDEALSGHGDSWVFHGGLFDLVQMAESMEMPHLDAFGALPYDVLRTTLGLPRLRWENWRLGPTSDDYVEPILTR